jgi:hypothetical protein
MMFAFSQTFVIDSYYAELHQTTNFNFIPLVTIDRVRKEEVLHRVKEERNIVHTIKRRKANWIGHSLRNNCFLKQVIEET